ncbi:hypothetical protein KAX29_03335 [candidate division WOR-3 bacterium]|nr:hypothetical protein [candidate division WOR-3 bacterium]
MAHAYTPGLKVTTNINLRKERRLPLKGDVIVKIGDRVKGEDIVARTELPGDVETVNLAGKLGVLPDELEQFMKKKEGDPIEKGETIAETSGLFGLFKTEIKSPIKGQVETISNITGQLILRGTPTPVEIDAYMDGRIVDIIENEGVVVESKVTFVQGIFGIGGETRGIIQPIVDSRKEVVVPEMIDESLRDKVLIGGSNVTKEAILKAVNVGAVGLVVGGIDDAVLKDFLGYEIGVAITGNENKGITLIITEGFGKMDMSPAAFRLLTQHKGDRASINGATQIRAGVLRPEVVVPLSESSTLHKVKDYSKGLGVGETVRIIREPYFGIIGKVIGLPPELKIVESESKVRILKVKTEEGSELTIPRANVEIIEE